MTNYFLIQIVNTLRKISIFQYNHYAKIEKNKLY